MKVDLLTQHLQTSRYGKFVLTEAVRPALDVPIRPREGYRVEIYRDRSNKFRLPTLSASVSAEHLFDVFLALLEPLGELVHVVLESSHHSKDQTHQDLRRNHIDRAVLSSYFCEFEDLLLNDGFTGVAVLSARRPMEVQFDEHKHIHIYAPSLRSFREILRDYGIRRRKEFAILSDAEHLHHSCEEHEELFRQLCLRVGVGDFDRVFSDEGSY